MTTREHVIAMANQIARNFAAQDRASAAAATARHMREFWDPRMRAIIGEEAARGSEVLSAEAKAAARLLSAPGMTSNDAPPASR